MSRACFESNLEIPQVTNGSMRKQTILSVQQNSLLPECQAKRIRPAKITVESFYSGNRSFRIVFTRLNVPNTSVPGISNRGTCVLASYRRVAQSEFFSIRRLLTTKSADAKIRRSRAKRDGEIFHAGGNCRGSNDGQMAIRGFVSPSPRRRVDLKLVQPHAGGCSSAVRA